MSHGRHPHRGGIPVLPDGPAPDGPVNVLAHVHRYPPEHNAGAEWMLHALLVYLADAGHSCRVLADVAEIVLDGIPVGPVPQPRRGLEDAYRWADVVVTHLDRTGRVVRHARAHGRPLVHLIHNHRQLRFHRVAYQDATLVVWNSEWIADLFPRWHAQSIVCRPPVKVADYQVDRPDAEHVTLVNLFGPKGAGLFLELAAAMPDVQFLGVRGAYGVQIEPTATLPNLTIIEQTPTIAADVYARTRVLLMPSGYESWGRVGVEAACSGIPTVAHPTEGLRESLGPAGIFPAELTVDAWQPAIRDLLDDDTLYRLASVVAYERALELQVQAGDDLERFEAAVRLAATAGD